MQRQIAQGRLEIDTAHCGIRKILFSLLSLRLAIPNFLKEVHHAGVGNNKVGFGIVLREVNTEADV